MTEARFAVRFEGLTAALRKRYGEPHRAYHTWTHIAALFGHFGRLRDRFARPEAVEIAIYYHDAIYDPLSKDNEADSAALMIGALADRIDSDTLAHANALVLATAGHRVPETVDEGLASDCALFLDMDLAILGADPDSFDDYARAIRQEYAAIPDEIFLPRRRAIMAEFLARPRLYLTDIFRRTHNQRARANLRRLVGRLAR